MVEAMNYAQMVFILIISGILFILQNVIFVELQIGLRLESVLFVKQKQRKMKMIQISANVKDVKNVAK